MEISLVAYQVKAFSTKTETDVIRRNPAHATEAAHAVVTQDLHAYYGNFAALKSVSLSFPNNSITALIGPSGCGKSTFLRTLNRMNDLIPGFSVQGRVFLNGIDVYDRRTDVVSLRKRVGMVFQRPNPFPMSIIDNVTWALRGHGVRGRRLRLDIAVESLKKAGLWEEVKDRLSDPAFALSGGQQQRLCIARAIAVKPTVILMDEPTSALDPVAASVVEELMLSLKEDYTVILVSHNMQQAGRVSDQCAVFLAGEVIEFGSTQVIFENPADKRTEDYITGRFG